MLQGTYGDALQRAQVIFSPHGLRRAWFCDFLNVRESPGVSDGRRRPRIGAEVAALTSVEQDPSA